jgi:hypothetical protein
MATLVLTAVGSAIGGPIGGALGAALGQRVDAAIFAPKAREGARLKELQVQTSSYGSQIPAIFGVMRVAGTVIWATDLIERRTKSGGSKGRPSTVNYSYSVNMAVALSSKPITRIGRIWADGNLLRGSAGDLKVDTQLRVYTGQPDQSVDPLLASAEQADQCPAHRGLAYVVFEDFQLADYGNRIPSLTFEVFERDAPVSLNAIFAQASGGAVNGQASQSLLGFAVEGATGREAIAPLLETLPIELSSRDGKLELRDRFVPEDTPLAPVVAVRENRENYDLPLTLRRQASQHPHSTALRYYDLDRDFQTSLQRSEDGSFSSNALQTDLPIVLRAAEAKQLVELRHSTLRAQQNGWRGILARNGQNLAPGSLFADAGQRWRVRQIEHRLGTMEIAADAAVSTIHLPASPAAPGRNISAPDLSIGETMLMIVELPATGIEDPGKPLIGIYAAGTAAGWRSAALSLKNGDALVDAGRTAAPAVTGFSIDALPAHNPLLLDEGTGLRVQLLHEAMDIPNRTGSPLDADAPYFFLGDEIVSYGRCEDLGSGIYRLSKLRRNCFRTTGVPSHLAGVRFILAEDSSLRRMDDFQFEPGSQVTFQALGLGDTEPSETSLSVEALATKPLPPVHGRFSFAGDGSVHFTWIRRSRLDTGWRDGVDQLMAEDSELYRIILLVGAAPVGEWTSSVSNFSLTATQLGGLGLGTSSSFALNVRQVGRHALSDALLIEANVSN